MSGPDGYRNPAVPLLVSSRQFDFQTGQQDVNAPGKEKGASIGAPLYLLIQEGPQFS